MDNIKWSFKLLCSNLFLLLASFFVNSCAKEEMADNSMPQRGDMVEYSFKISGLASNTSQNGEKTESIKSLRIIIIDAGGAIDANERIDFTSENHYAATFSYEYSKILSLNEKRLYLIANEESVGETFITDRSGLPGDLPLERITSLLDYFSVENSGNIPSTAPGDVFEKVLNRIYFENDYPSMMEDDKIFLPYSSQYNLEYQDYAFLNKKKTFYLVPVAVKFDFNIINYRQNNVEVKDMIFCNVNSENFLNAQFEDGVRHKTLKGESVWWIDWMEECAKTSHTAEDIEAFNSAWGWIENYSMPTSLPAVEKSLHAATDEWKLAGMVDKNNPDKIQIGPFYLPESKNLEELEELEEKEVLEQIYSLNFKIYDEAEDDTQELKGYKLTTLKSLFRGTHTHITVELFEKAIDIYAEIVPWEFKSFKGFVQQEDD